MVFGQRMRIREKTLTILLVLSFVANVSLLAVVLVPEDEISPALSKPEEVQTFPTATMAPLPPVRGTGNGSAASLQVPVIIQTVEVDRGGPLLYEEVTEEGAMVNVSVEVVPGRGRVLVQTTPLMGIAFQDAANLAVVVAADRSRVNLTGSDIIFSIQGPEEVSEIDGPSAGALMAVLLISVLEGLPLDGNVTVTGSIDENGGIGPVGGVLEKAEAAAASGKPLLGLPEGNERMVEYRAEGGPVGWPMPGWQRPVIVDAKEFIEENFGIQVKYAGSIEDLLADICASDDSPAAPLERRS